MIVMELIQVMLKVYQNSSDSWQQLGSDIIGEASADFSGNAVSLSSNGENLVCWK